MPSRSIYVVTYRAVPPFWLSTVPFHICHIFIHSSLDEHLGSLHILAVVSKFTVNLTVQISLVDRDFILFYFLFILIGG